MKYIAIIDNKTVNKEELLQIVNSMSKIGYKEAVYYVTSKHTEIKHGVYVSSNEFDKLVKKGVIVAVEEKDNSKIGISNPVGYQNYVGIVSYDTYLKLKKKYKNQIIGLEFNKGNNLEVHFMSCNSDYTASIDTLESAIKTLVDRRCEENEEM